MAPATAAEIETLAREHGLDVVRSESSADAEGRTSVSWEVVWLRLREDGTAALPLLRHVVLKERKSSTYKLALLWILTRIAEGTPGYHQEVGDDTVQLPAGLVALYWLRAFRPLIARRLPQRPRGAKPSFVAEGFRRLETSRWDYLKPGRLYAVADALHLAEAIVDAGTCIAERPAQHATYRGGNRQVFGCERADDPIAEALQGRGEEVLVDGDFLGSFGTFSLPRGLW